MGVYEGSPGGGEARRWGGEGGAGGIGGIEGSGVGEGGEERPR